jgi:hypothetical protein
MNASHLDQQKKEEEEQQWERSDHRLMNCDKQRK